MSDKTADEVESEGISIPSLLSQKESLSVEQMNIMDPSLLSIKEINHYRLLDLSNSEAFMPFRYLFDAWRLGDTEFVESFDYGFKEIMSNYERNGWDVSVYFFSALLCALEAEKKGIRKEVFMQFFSEITFKLYDTNDSKYFDYFGVLFNKIAKAVIAIFPALYDEFVQVYNSEENSIDEILEMIEMYVRSIIDEDSVKNIPAPLFFFPH